jgi:hypothetical protein
VSWILFLPEEFLPPPLSPLSVTPLSTANKFIVLEKKRKPKTTKGRRPSVYTPIQSYGDSGEGHQTGADLTKGLQVYDTSVADMKLPLHDTQTSTVTNKTCLLCGWTPFAEHVELHARIVKELKERDDHDKIQDRETVKRSLQSGIPHDTVDVDLFNKKARLVDSLKKVRTREEVEGTTPGIVPLTEGIVPPSDDSTPGTPQNSDTVTPTLQDSPSDKVVIHSDGVN